MAGGRIDDGFGKEQGTCSGRIAQDFGEKFFRVTNAGSMDADDDAQALAGKAGASRSQSFDGGGGSVLGNCAGAAQSRVRETGGPRVGRGHGADGKLPSWR